MTDRGRPPQGGRGKRRRKRKRSSESTKAAPSEPVMITARRPGSPRLLGQTKTAGRRVAASAVPKAAKPTPELDSQEPKRSSQEPAPRRAARIIEFKANEPDQLARKRELMLARVVEGHGRSEITRAVNEFLGAGFVLPAEQEVMMQLLEHLDERRVQEAITVLASLIEKSGPPKRGLLGDRLKRLEEYADERATREAAAGLRRVLRSAQVRAVGDDAGAQR